MKHYNKLVRDRIPEIIAAQGKSCQARVMGPDEYLNALHEKLGEELDEYRAGHDLLELADLMEVIYAIAAHRGLTEAELDAMRQAKRAERGGFADRLMLLTVSD